MKTPRVIVILALAVLAGAFSLACVTAADLYEISDAVRQLEEGEATTAETAARIDARVDVVQERTEELVGAGNLPKTPGEWAAYLLSLGLAGGGSAVALNRYRNRQRILRGERVDPAPPVAP